MRLLFLTLPMIQWSPGGWHVTWFSTAEIGLLDVGPSPLSLTRRSSHVTKLERLSERRRGAVPRNVYRHQVSVDDVPGRHVWHSATIRTSNSEVSCALTCSRRPSDEGGMILLTSDHQAMPLTAFATTMMLEMSRGALQAVFYAGDCVNVPDRASEWFTLPRGNSFFECLQGSASSFDSNSIIHRGGGIAQQSPIYTCVGNHEVMGRVTGRSLDHAFNEPVPRAVAVAEFERSEGRVPTALEDWRRIEDDSWSIRTYQEVFSLEAAHDGWYATRVGNVWLVSLFATRAWRPKEASVNPDERQMNSRYHDAAGHVGEPLERGYGSFPFVPVGAGSRQYEWLKEQLNNPEREQCDWTIVMLHEGPFSTGDNVMPPWCEPEPVYEYDRDGAWIGTRYEYQQQRNPLLNDLVPLFDRTGVNLVLSGHNHVWNRFQTPAGVHYLETSNVGNTYGSTEAGMLRHTPPVPWASNDYLTEGSPGGLSPIRASAAGVTAVAENGRSVFSFFDSRTGTVTTWVADPEGGCFQLDVFRLNRHGESG